MEWPVRTTLSLALCHTSFRRIDPKADAQTTTRPEFLPDFWVPATPFVKSFEKIE